ncbi:MAG: hypothetical protein RIQ89_896 [Bacteroidota bacterium]
MKILFPASKQLFILCALVTMLSSCTMNKRLYNGGYHIEWGSIKKQDLQKRPYTDQISFKDLNKEPERVLRMPEVSLAPKPMASAKNKGSVFTSRVRSQGAALAQKGKAALASAIIKNKLSKAQERFEEVMAVPPPSGGYDPVLLVILAVLIPPLAMYLFQGSWNNQCWISLLLSLLFFIPGVIYTLIVILD